MRRDDAELDLADAVADVPEWRDWVAGLVRGHDAEVDLDHLRFNDSPLLDRREGASTAGPSFAYRAGVSGPPSSCGLRRRTASK